MKQHLLLIEDDERLGALVSEYLTDAGFDITHVLNAGDGFGLGTGADELRKAD